MLISTFSKEVTQLHAEICSALGDAHRILILYTLFEKPYTVNDLADKLSLSQPATSRHLKTLKERGLVHFNRQGASVEYSLSDARLIQALDLLREVLKDRIAYRAELMNNE